MFEEILPEVSNYILDFSLISVSHKMIKGLSPLQSKALLLNLFHSDNDQVLLNNEVANDRRNAIINIKRKRQNCIQPV